MKDPAAHPLRLRVLVAHNAYRQRGGEDAVVESEIALLRKHGHEVETYTRHNDEGQDMSTVRLAADAIWSRRTTFDMERMIAEFEPDVVHVHNTLSLISPSIYWAAARARIPVVQTLHNFRLLCPKGTMVRDGKLCTTCVGKPPLAAVLRRCYRDSAAQSAVVGLSISGHRSIGTWSDKVAAYIVPNEFAVPYFVRGGIPSEKIRIKPNFVLSPSRTGMPRGNSFLYVGRLSEEKGIEILAAAIRMLPETTFTIVGDGPLRGCIEGLPNVTHLGYLSREEVAVQMSRAKALVVPSIGPEMFGLAAVEAFACGVPVIASRAGALQYLVEEGKTGLLVAPHNCDDLARRLQWAQENDEALQCMGANARSAYERHYTPENNLAMMQNIYIDAISATGGGK